MTDKKTEALKLALADSALERMAENARELGLDYEPIVEKVEDSVGMGHKAWDMVDPNEIAKAFHEALAEPPCKTGSQCTSKCQQCEQTAQQQEQKLEFVSPGGGYVPAIPRPMPLDWKLVPRKATPEMLKAMDECAQEGYDERLYAGMASSVYMAAWDASPVLGTLPTSEKEDQMMDMIVGNLVREGINKHRARELADHFIKQCNYTNGYCTGRTDLLAEQTAHQQEQGDSNCQDADGCPTEMAVLQRFWRGQSIPTEHYPAWFKPAQQQGWKLVPVEPTKEMLTAGRDAHFEAENKINDPGAWKKGGFAQRKTRAKHVFQAMLNAAPPASKPWVGLTLQEIEAEWDEFMSAKSDGYVPDFVRAIEAKLREKNA